MSNDKQFDIDSLLDGTLDDLADLPEFRPLPVGTYVLDLHIEADKKNKAIYYAKLKVKETKELADSSEVPVEAGAEANVRYDLSNEYGQGGFKKILISLNAHFKCTNNRALLEELRSPVEVIATTKQNLNKKNGQIYTDIVELMVV